MTNEVKQDLSGFQNTVNQLGNAIKKETSPITIETFLQNVLCEIQNVLPTYSEATKAEAIEYLTEFAQEILDGPQISNKLYRTIAKNALGLSKKLTQNQQAEFLEVRKQINYLDNKYGAIQ